MDTFPRLPEKPTFNSDIKYLQQIINTQQQHINWAAHEVHRAKILVDKMSEALVNIKQFSQTGMQSVHEKSCKHKDCKAVQERMEKTLRSIIDLENHSLQPN